MANPRAKKRVLTITIEYSLIDSVTRELRLLNLREVIEAKALNPDFKISFANSLFTFETGEVEEVKPAIAPDQECIIKPSKMNTDEN